MRLGGKNRSLFEGKKGSGSFLSNEFNAAYGSENGEKNGQKNDEFGHRIYDMLKEFKVRGGANIK